MDDDKNVIFGLERNYPDANNIFGTKRTPILDVLDTCDIVLDTNVLLLPYRTASEDFEQIRIIYEEILDRLYIPERVAREFARQRPHALQELAKNLDMYYSSSRISKLDIPLLSSELIELRTADLMLVEARKEFRRILKDVKNRLDSWEHSDPVMNVYHELFGKVVLLGPSMNEEEILEQLKSRHAREMPPSYENRAKIDGGVGNLIIWLSMLEHAKQAKNDMIFVTNNIAGWCHLASRNAFLPRIELINEYSYVSNGKCLYIISLSELLRLHNVEIDDID